MSRKLVRKLLQASEFDADVGADHARPLSKKRKKTDTAEEKKPVDPVQLHVQSMLRLDRAISMRDATGHESLQRVIKKQQQQGRQRSKSRNSADGGVGNSRSSCSRRSQLRPEPTFDKKKDALAKRQKSIQEIAKLLKKQSKKKRNV